MASLPRAPSPARLPLSALPGAHLLVGLALGLRAPDSAAALALAAALGVLAPAPVPALGAGVALGWARARIAAPAPYPLRWDAPREPAGPCAGLRRRLRSRLRDLPAPSRDLARALVLGDRLSRERRVTYARAGILHLAAQSGLHVGIVLGLAGLVLARAGPGPSRAGALLVALGYALLAGGRPGALRAVVVVALAGALRRLGLRGEPRGILLLTATLFLLTAPGLLATLGAQLSFAAALGILHLGPVLRRRLRVPHAALLATRPATFLADLATTSAAATLGTLPVLLAHLGRAPLLGVLPNLVAVPVGTLLVPWSGALLTRGLLPDPARALMVHGHSALVAVLDGVGALGATWLPPLEVAHPSPLALAGLALPLLLLGDAKDPSSGEGSFVPCRAESPRRARA